MAFKLYQNKNSLLNPNCRLVRGGSAEQDDIFVGYWTKKKFPVDEITDVKFTITADYAFRADKISYKMYGRDDFMWLVLEYNNIVDINEELVIGAVLKLPSYARTLYNLTSD